MKKVNVVFKDTREQKQFSYVTDMRIINGPELPVLRIEQYESEEIYFMPISNLYAWNTWEEDENN